MKRRCKNTINLDFCSPNLRGRALQATGDGQERLIDTGTGEL